MSLTSFVSVIAGLSWLLVLILIGMTVAKAARGGAKAINGGLIIGVIVLALAINILSAGLEFIEPNKRGVVISAVPGAQGVRQEALQPGLNWIVPFFDRVVQYSISRQTYTMSIAHSEGQIQGDDSVEARTADGQVVFVDASVIFALNPAEVVNIHVGWQNTYVDGLIRPLTRGVIRDTVSSYGIKEVYGVKRVEMTTLIQEELVRKFEEEGIVLIDFVLRNVAFSPEYAASVEQKQIAEQLAQQAQFVVEQRRQEAEQARQAAQGVADSKVIEAEGAAKAVVIAAEAQAKARLIQAEAEAQALRLLGEALAAYPDVLSLQYIEKLAPNVRVMLLPTSGDQFILPLPDVTP